MKKIILLLTLFVMLRNEASAQKEGQALIDSLLVQLPKAKEDTNKVNILKSLSWELINTGDYTKAKQYADDLLAISEKIDLPDGSHGFKKGIAYAYNNIGTIYHLQGNYPDALKNHFAALKLREEIGDKKGIVGSYNNIGCIYDEQGNYPEALKKHYAALKIGEEIGYKRAIANSYHNIGRIYSAQSDYPEALKNYSAALKIKEEIGDKIAIANTYNNIGRIYFNQGNYPEALKNHFAALKIFEKIGHKKGIAASYGNIGNICYIQGNYSEALINYFAALKIEEEIGNKMGIAICYINLGGVNTELKKFTEAKKYLEDGLRLSKEIGTQEWIKNSYSGLAALDSATSNWKDAYLHHKLYILYRDSLVNEENTKKTVQTKIQYEFDKLEDSRKLESKKKEIALQKEIELKALKYEYDKKQAAAKTEKEKQQLAFEQEIKRQEIENKYTQKIAHAESLAKQQELERKQRDLAAKAEQEKKDIVQRNIRNSFLAGIFFLIILSALLYYSFRIKQKANKKLDEANNDLSKLNERIISSMNNLEATQKQLLKAEKMAAFGSMATRMAHEIQNPLNFVNNFSKLSEELATEIAAAKTEEERNETIIVLKQNLNKINQHGNRVSEIIAKLNEHADKGTTYEFFEEK